MEMGSVSQRGPATAPKHKCILVVDDEFLIRWMLCEDLREAGYHVIEACDASEALLVLETLSPDFIISDVRMPGPVDGMGLLARVRETKPALPIMIISGHLDPDHALTEGATHFVAKPFRPHQVIDTVQALLDKPK